MDRRTFLKVMGAAFAARPFDASGSLLAASVQQAQAESSLPRIRLIVVGADSVNLQTWDAEIAGWPKENVLCIDSVGHIRQCLTVDSDVFPQKNGWQRCCDALPFLSLKKAQFRTVEKEVASFIRAADWLFMVVMLDNAIAFAACDEIAKIAKNAGVLTMAYVGMPGSARSYPGEEAVHNDRLKKYSRDAIDRMLGACDLVLPDEGSWSYSGWTTGHHGTALDLISCAIKNKEHADQLTAMLTTAGMGFYGLGISDNVHEAIQDALDPDMSYSCQDSVVPFTHNGAIIMVTSHPEVVESLRNDVVMALRHSPADLGGNCPFWRREQKWMVITRPEDDFSSTDRAYFLEALSIGSEKAQPPLLRREPLNDGHYANLCSSSGSSYCHE